jgi:glycosyltransferase involved in cell wall biosynthesis
MRTEELASGKNARKLLEHSDIVELTILMPCLNESETLGVCIDKAQQFLAKSAVRGEVLIADNGSTDGSRALAEELGARVVLVRERGYGAALLGGIAAARGRYVIFGDADDSYDFSNLQPFLDRLREGYDLVMGNRFQGGIARGAMPPLHRYIGNPVLSMLGRIFFKIPVGDFHCGLRGFNMAAVRRLNLRTSGMEFASELVVRFALVGGRVTEVPTRLAPDGRSRAPHLKTWQDGWRHLKFLLMYSPKWLFIYPGLTFIVFGCLLALALSMGPIQFVDRLTFDQNTFIAACFLVIVGVQLVTFGALSRVYASNSGILPHNTRSDWLAYLMSTDRLVRTAGMILVVGLLVFGSALYEWAKVDFGPLTNPLIPRAVEAGLSLIVVSIQLGFAAFMFGILEIPFLPSAGKK